MTAAGLMLSQAVGFDLVSMLPDISPFAVATALLVLTFFVLAFVYWKRKHSQE